MPTMKSFSFDDAPSIVLAFREAIDAALDALAQHQETEDGEWLIQVEREAIRRTKGLIGEGVAMEKEVAMIGVGVEALTAVFSSYRRKIADA